MKERSFAFYSDTGGRANNEDSYLAKQIGNSYLFIVADGLGGHDAGELASKAAVEAVRKYMTESRDKDLVKAIEQANRDVLMQCRATSSKMKTTVAAVFIEKEYTTIAHVGDTRVYAFNKSDIVFRTKDHSASQLAVSMGEIEDCDIRTHADRNILSRALGAAEEIRIDVKKLHNLSFDSLLLCSDGFWEYVMDEEMSATLAGVESADKWLYKMRGIQLRRAPESCDNNTAVAVLML